MSPPGAVRPSSPPRQVRKPAEQKPSSRGGAVATWLLCLAPIAVLPGLYDRWGWPTLLLVMASAAVATWCRPRGRIPGWVWAFVAGGAVVLVAAALTGAEPIAQLFGRAPRYDGLVALPAVVAAAWTAARVQGSHAADDVRRPLVIALTACSVLLAAVALLESFGLRPFESNLDRPGALAGNATDQGILGVVYVGLLGSIALGAWQRQRRALAWAWFGVLAGVVSVAASASRGALVALVVVALSLVGRLILAAHRRGLAAVVAAGALCATTLLVVAMPLTRDRLFEGAAFAGETIEDRFIMWSYAWEIWRASPWLGVGPGGFTDAAPLVFGDDWFQRAAVGSVLDSPHSLFADIALGGGIAGLIVACGFTIAAYATGFAKHRTATGAWRDLLFASLITVPAVVIALFTQVTSAKTLVPLAMMLGWLVCASPVAARAARAMTATARAVIAVWAVLLALGALADAFLLDGVRAVNVEEFTRADASFSTARVLRPWDVDVALIAAESFTGAVDRGLAAAGDVAVRWSQEAVELVPGSYRAQQIAGALAMSQGELAEARRYFEAAVSLSPADPRLSHELGIARFATGDLVGARSALERALVLAPDSAVTWQALEAVCAELGADDCGPSN